MRVPLALVAVAGMVLAGCASEADFTPIASADWQPGYTFSYEFEGKEAIDGHATFIENGEMEESDDDEFGTTIIEVTPSATFRVLNTALTPGTSNLYMAAATDGPLTFGEAFTRDDAATTRFRDVVGFDKDSLTATRFFFAPSACPTCPDVLQESNGFDTYDWLRFPLARGNTWNATMGWGSGWVTSGSGGDEVVVEVGGLVKVDSPAGKVDAVRITHTSQPMSDEERDMILEGAERQGIIVDEFETDVEQVVDVYYAPSLHAIVLWQLHASGGQRIRAHNATFSIDVDVTIEATRTMRLTAADYTTIAPVELDAVGSILGSTVTLDPNSPLPANQTLAIEADTDRITLDDAIQFTVRAPSGVPVDQVTTTIKDASGSTVQSSTGAKVSFRPTAPGGYVATATLPEGSDATARWPFAVDLAVQKSVPCSIGNDQMPCTASLGDLPPGILNATLRATRASLVPDAGTAFQLLADGTEIANAEFANNVAVINLDGTIQGGAWTITLDAPAQAFVTYTLQGLVSYAIPA